jgi:hypothetical protein
LPRGYHSPQLKTGLIRAFGKRGGESAHHSDPCFIVITLLLQR